MSDETTLLESVKKLGPVGLLLSPILAWLGKAVITRLWEDWWARRAKMQADHDRIVAELKAERDARLAELKAELAEAKEETERAFALLASRESELQSVARSSASDAKRFADAAEALQARYSELMTAHMELLRDTQNIPRKVTPTPR